MEEQAIIIRPSAPTITPSPMHTAVLASATTIQADHDDAGDVLAVM
jgi:hypothetical protein